MSYYDLTPSSREGKIGQQIYLSALSDRRGFRCDQIGIEADDIWEDIFEEMGKAALKAIEQNDPRAKTLPA